MNNLQIMGMLMASLAIPQQSGYTVTLVSETQTVNHEFFYRVNGGNFVLYNDSTTVLNDVRTIQFKIVGAYYNGEEYYSRILDSNRDLILGTNGESSIINITSNTTFYLKNISCLTGDTLVTMANGTEKRLDEIEVGDYVLSYDWYTLQHVARRVIYTDKAARKSYHEYDKWTFSDGTVVKTVHRHEFYCVESTGMKYMDEWEIGEHTHKKDGTQPALLAHEKVHEIVNHYKITLEGSTNYFANGLLTGDRYCPSGIVLPKANA